MRKIFPNIYIDNRGKLYTPNLVPGVTVYEERLKKFDGIELRQWDERRSKLAAAIMKRVSQIGLRDNDYVLYLGASTGTTVSHVSDIVGPDGLVFALEFAPRVLRDLVFMAEKRKNIAPILADANQPNTFYNKLCLVDFVFQDIAQRNQSEIFLKNCAMFLKEDGFGMLSVKSRSIDISKKPSQIYSEVRQELEKEMLIVDYKMLDPIQKDHCIFVCKKR
ncbi:fibrillarin-like rRNA/tRNA 2'-O-methyltransferase [archaeon]|jgi:fibrillarin-like pre-rRNA processing protein|nr:fibrillarin-like rRNA/tRNA 2'-O-methyltransferase [archaeon]MBT4350888.1 fibrillarin-like rRNA/tRNA 2'-O-methyltransferase [archaeon]MBT4646920.1 fibrillarin-like rRNA/tRNA 2'-O-methyltransferase [archaeon]MBT6821588.1 fibrillarin-like rRNA/tRNA 2'-O-methyltransferase [archaeon]MBT7392082.1 fibrillarin-like rRNA/tRNA 2'-O-methyltransferase [archaeon]